MLNNYSILKNIILKIRKEGKISEDLKEELVKLIGNERMNDVFEYINENRVKKYIFTPSKRELWVVYGKSGYYLIYPMEFCSCIDYYKTSIINNKKNFCKHLLAQAIINETSKNIRDLTINLNDNEFKNLLNEILIKEI